jgi:hypothetical protein
MFFSRKARREVEELTWRTIDQEIDEPGFNRLEQFLRESDEARQIYVESHWLHTALLFHFNPDYGKRFMPAQTTEQMFMDELMKSEPLADCRELARKQRSKKTPSSN